MSDQVQEQSQIMQHFVLREPRPKQITALEYVERKYAEGFRHIVIAAPTGVGKSAMTGTACFWSQTINAEGFDSGGYVLVGQKLLQDQYANDFKTYAVEEPLRRCQSLKSSAEYACRWHGNCAYGIGRKVKCVALREKNCSYIKQRNAWENATMAVTNYPYLFTEHWMAGKLPPRKVLALDECHTLERQILGFIEVSITQQILQKWTPLIKQVPEFEDINDFALFLQNTYLPALQRKLDTLFGTEGLGDEQKVAQEKLDLENHIGRIGRGADLIKEDPQNWIFWQERNRNREMEAFAKPLEASPFSQELLFEMGHLCLHLSAYPGSKVLYCQSLGLEPDEVAWLNLNSPFAVENRPIYVVPVGSMSRRNRDQTMPELLAFIDHTMEAYTDSRGIIHCGSYEIGTQIYDGLRGRPQGRRLVFPQSAQDRDPAFLQHKQRPGSVIISPSMMEGFDFINDLARWQVIAKVPYPYLGDRQVAAKKEISQKWYDFQAVSSVIQACGRIVRSNDDFGHTYLVDSDFLTLFERNEEMYPRWWMDALVWPKRGSKV